MVTINRTLSNLSKAGNEAQQRYLSDQAERATASHILRPDEVAGTYDAGRLLQTTLGTLGGSMRALTAADLMVFKKNVQMLGKAFHGGITAKGVIDRSRQEDRERSNEEIRVALPVMNMGGKVHFVTNSGPKSKVSRHHVIIEFLNYDSATASPASLVELSKMVTVGALKFDCDCEHHRFTYRYIASIGRFNAGRVETGFPKITNPHLTGVGCKHVLRVMQQIQSPLIRSYVSKMIERGRSSMDRKAVKTTVKDSKELAKQQVKQAGWKRSTIETTSERKVRLAQQRRVKEIVEKSKVSVAKPTPLKLANAKKKFAQQARNLAAFGGISQKMLADILAKLQGK